MKFWLFIALCAANLCASSSPEPYYRLDNFDSRYKLLDDPPAPSEKIKQLNPSALYKANRPARIKKKPPYRRVEIFPPAKRVGSDKKMSYRRIKIIPNKQALIRSGLPYYEPRAHFLLLGLNSGVDLFGANGKTQATAEIAGKIGWHFYFTDDDDSSAMRIYATFGAPLPINPAIPKAISANLNVDFLINAIYLDFFIGGGYGGDYFLDDKFFSHGFLLNAGISKAIDAHQIEVSARVPFYKKRNVNHIVDIVLSWHYLF